MTVYPTEYPAAEAIALIIDSKQIRSHHLNSNGLIVALLVVFVPIFITALIKMQQRKEF